MGITVKWHQRSYYIFPIHNEKSHFHSYITIHLFKFRNNKINKLLEFISGNIYNLLIIFFSSKEIDKIGTDSSSK